MSITTDTTSNWGILQGHTRSTWAIDPAATRIGFGVRNLMVRTVRGSFADAEGTIILDEADRCMCRVEIAIPATSIDTGNSGRDKHLRGADMLDVERFPRILFHSTRVDPSDETHARVIGQLTIRDTTREVVLRVAQEGGVRAADGRETVRYTASTSIDRRDYGASGGPKTLIGNTLDLQLDIRATRQSG